MRACVQRVREASVSVEGEVVGEIGPGLVVLLGVATDDGETQIRWMAEKLTGLRIFPDDDNMMNRSLVDVGGQMLVVSQFTLLGDCRKGKRPSFIAAAPPEKANQLYLQFVEEVRRRGVDVATGQFRAMMQVSLVNDGPVTLVVDSP